ncbi:Hypothetical protein NocV09_01501060 [Nannochloropsis oceanica]
MNSLLSELQQRVQELYDSAPGSSIQREADQWLTSFVNVEGAWEVLLHVLSIAAAQQQQSLQSQGSDVRLLFISAKILQLKIQHDWRLCSPETRQAVQQCLSSHLRHEALGTAPPHAPIVHSQLVLAFVHMVLQVLSENHISPTPSFVLSLCQMFGITGMPDLATQSKPILLVLEVLKWLPEEYNRRDPGSSRRHRRTIRLQRPDSQATIELIRVVLGQCDGIEGNYGGLEPISSADIRQKIKLACLQCLRSWTEHTTLDESWATTTDMMAGGVLADLERQATLIGGVETLPAEMYAIVMQILTDGFRNHHFFGSSDPKGPQGGPEEAALRKQAFWTVSRIVLVMGKYAVQRGNVYEDSEEVARSACDALVTLLQWHLAPMFAAYRDNLHGTSEGDAALSLMRELLQLLVQFTGHADLSGVAEPPLELWYFLPELLDLQESFTPEAGALLEDILPSLVEIVHRQCMAPATWGEKEWGVAFMNRSARKNQADQNGEAEGGGGETDWDQFMDLVYFRTGANDVIEAMASNWPEKKRPGEVLYTIMSRCSDNPLAVEAVLFCLTGVARGLQSGYDYYTTDEDEVDEEGRGIEGEGEYYGYGDDDNGRDNDEIYVSEEVREQKRQEAAQQRQPELWSAVLQAVTSLQEVATCFYLWRTACFLIRELARVYLLDLATPTEVEHVVVFLVRALDHQFTCSVAAMTLKNVISKCCTSVRGNLIAGKEVAIRQRLISLITGALTTTAQQRAQERVRLLLNQPRAYANVVESLVILILTAVSTVKDSTAPAMLEQLGITVTSTLATTSARGRGASAQALSAILAGVRRGKGLKLIDTLLQRAWPVIDQVVFGTLSEQENPTMAVHAACKVLGAILRAVEDKALFLPLVIAKVGPLVEFNGQVLEHYRNTFLPTVAAQQRKPSQQEMAEVVLWPAPLVFVRRVLAVGGETSLHGWWPAFQQVTDAVCRLAAQSLALKIGDEDEHGNQNRRQLLVDFYKEFFDFLKDMVTVATDGAPPTSLLSDDPYCVRRGLELVIVALELPLENSGSLSKVLAYLSATLRLFQEDVLLPAVLGLAPRLTLALLQVLVSTINMPTNIKRATADVLHLALFGPHGTNKNKNEMRVPVCFQQSLSTLLDSQRQNKLQAIFVQNPSAVDWVRQTFLAILQQAPVGPGQKNFVDFVKYFTGLARNEMTLEEVRESLELNKSSASIFPDL